MAAAGPIGVRQASSDGNRGRAVDRLLFFSLALLAVLAGGFHPHPLRLLLAFAALALFLWASGRLAPRSRGGDALHAFAPLVVIIGVYETVGFVVGATNPARWDAWFAAVDVRIFGGLIPAWRGALGRPAWLSDLLSVCYVSYYFVPTAMAVSLYAHDRRDEFERFVFGLVVTLLASYAGYFLFPTAGPRVPLEQGSAVLGGGAVSAGVRASLHLLELNEFDAFPSGHTAVSLVFLGYGWSLYPRWRAPLAMVVVGIVFSTVYLSHHYVIDLAAGAALAGLALVSAPALQRAFAGNAPSWGPAQESSSP